MRAYQTAYQTRGSKWGRSKSGAMFGAFGGRYAALLPALRAYHARAAGIEPTNGATMMMKLHPAFSALSFAFVMTATVPAAAATLPDKFETGACWHPGLTKEADVSVTKYKYKKESHFPTTMPGKAIFRDDNSEQWGTVRKLDTQTYQLIFDKRKPVTLKKIAPPKKTNLYIKTLLIDEEKNVSIFCEEEMDSF